MNVNVNVTEIQKIVKQAGFIYVGIQEVGDAPGLENIVLFRPSGITGGCIGVRISEFCEFSVRLASAAAVQRYRKPEKIDTDPAVYRRNSLRLGGGPNGLGGGETDA